MPEILLDPKRCYNCGKRCTGKYKTIESTPRTFCRKCYDKYYTHCHKCNKITYRFLHQIVLIGSWLRFLCKDCFDKDYFYCGGCCKVFKVLEDKKCQNKGTSMTVYCKHCFRTYRIGDIYITNRGRGLSNKNLIKLLLRKPKIRRAE